MTAAPDLDPYLLPLPTPASPVVLPHLASPLHAHLNGRYGDPVWPLAPLTGNPSASKPSDPLGAVARRVPGRDAAGGLEPDQRPAPAHVPARTRPQDARPPQPERGLRHD